MKYIAYFYGLLAIFSFSVGLLILFGQPFDFPMTNKRAFFVFFAFGIVFTIIFIVMVNSVPRRVHHVRKTKQCNI